MNRTQVLEQVQPLTGFRLRDLGQPVVLLDKDGELQAIRPDRGARSVELTAKAIESLFQQVNLREPLARKLSGKTKAAVVNEALSETPAALMIRDGVATDVVPAKSIHLTPPERVTQVLERAIPDADFTHVSILPHHVVHLELMGHEEKAVRPGDLVRAGVATDFSVLGGHSPMVRTYVHRLACTNGAVTNDVLAEFSFRDNGGDDLFHWLRLKARQAYRSLDKVISRWTELTQQEVTADQRAEVLAHWIDEARIPPEFHDAIQSQALREPPQTQYDMMNLITWATSHISEMEPARRVRSLNEVARLQHHTVSGRTCPTCHRSR